jgi:hypothetical protein
MAKVKSWLERGDSATTASQASPVKTRCKHMPFIDAGFSFAECGINPAVGIQIICSYCG